LNSKQIVKKLLEANEVSSKHPFAELLKFMTVEEQDKAYSVFLKNGNYDSRKTFLTMFGEDIFNIATGQPILINETETPSRKKPLLTEESRDKLKDFCSIIVAITEAKSKALEVARSNENIKDLLLKFASVSSDVLKGIDEQYVKHNEQANNT